MKTAAVLDMLARLVMVKPSINSMLDVGCGRSHFAAVVKKSFGFDKVVAVDLVELFPDNEQYGVESFLGDFNTLELPDEKFDVITDVCSIHLFNPTYSDACPNIGMRDTYRKLYNLLNPGGVLLSCTDVSSTDDVGEFIGPQQVMTIADEVGYAMAPYVEATNPHKHDHPFGMGPNNGKPIQIYMLAMEKA